MIRFCSFGLISIHALREEGDGTNSQVEGQRKHFYPRPPRGGRRRIPLRSIRQGAISIHALREEGDLLAVVANSGLIVFLSTPSARRATPLLRGFLLFLNYFYPRPPRGGRQSEQRKHRKRTAFLSTPSARRATRLVLSPYSAARFLSTPSARRATSQNKGAKEKVTISIHALREEGDRRKAIQSLTNLISIHALREEGDHSIFCVYSTQVCISIHALREEGDL